MVEIGSELPGCSFMFIMFLPLCGSVSISKHITWLI